MLYWSVSSSVSVSVAFVSDVTYVTREDTRATLFTLFLNLGYWTHLIQTLGMKVRGRGSEEDDIVIIVMHSCSLMHTKLLELFFIIQPSIISKGVLTIIIIVIVLYIGVNDKIILVVPTLSA